MVRLECNSTNFYNLSQLCLERPDDTELCCFGDSSNSSVIVLRMILGSVAGLVCFLGVMGHLATLVAIPLAAMKKKHIFDTNFRRLAIFILNLSFVELIILLFLLLPVSYSLCADSWPFGSFLCKVTAVLYETSCTLESTSIMLISLGRCIDMTKPVTWIKLTDNNIFLVFILSVPWLLAIPPIILTLLSSPMVFIGWDCRLGICRGMILPTWINGSPHRNEKGEKKWKYLSLYIFIISLMAITCTVVSYVIIRRKVRQSQKNLERLNQEQMTSLDNQIRHREDKMTRTILVLVVSHCVCNIPIIFNDFIGESGLYMLTGLDMAIHDCLAYLFYIIMIFQYNFNVYIYGFTNKQFQKSYIHLFKYISCQPIIVNTYE